MRRWDRRWAVTIRAAALALASLILAALAGAGCDRGLSSKPVSGAKSPTIASVVPSASDLIVSMGAADHLVAVGNYDHDPRTDSLPKIGDYETVDWEKLASIRPNVIITYHAAGNGQDGFAQKAAQLGIREANIRFDRLSELYDAIQKLGELCEEPANAGIELQRVRDGLAAVQKRVAGQPRVRALIVTEASGVDFAGRENHLDDLLNIAGGENAIAAHRYVRLDREAIAALEPQVVLQLLPGADRITQENNLAFWNSFTDMPAVKEHRVYQFTESYIMVPGSRVTAVAEKFAAALHPQKETPSHPSTTRAAP